ncbi:MAG: gamma-glutamylcyclotransferase [Gammaproteobacteria bacterium]|nr:gamma-glutamylcyclotransferase [Gammaproteobacteria bacterium]
MKVFFYGLFMDERLLATKGIEPADVKLGFVDGHRLRIGERATLIRRPGGRVYGAMMDIAPAEATALYAEDSLADYLPEAVVVELMDGKRVEATCYILPPAKVSGTNRRYAEALLEVATRLDFPESYLDQIRLARK